MLDEALEKAKGILSNYEKRNGLEIVDSNVFKMSERFYRVENLTNDGRIGVLIIFHTVKYIINSWIIFYPTEKDRKALGEILLCINTRIHYNKRPFLVYPRGNKSK